MIEMLFGLIFVHLCACVSIVLTQGLHYLVGLVRRRRWDVCSGLTSDVLGRSWSGAKGIPRWYLCAGPIGGGVHACSHTR